MPRAPILAERRQRLRDMRQGLDGLLDVRTHEDPRALCGASDLPRDSGSGEPVAAP